MPPIGGGKSASKVTVLPSGSGIAVRNRAAPGAVRAPGPIEQACAQWRVPVQPAEVLLHDADGPIALAEERDDGLLKAWQGLTTVEEVLRVAGS